MCKTNNKAVRHPQFKENQNGDDALLSLVTIGVKLGLSELSLRCNDKYITTIPNENRDPFRFIIWDDADFNQKLGVLHLMMQLGVAKSNDVVQPFTVRRLHANNTVMKKSAKEFRDHFTKYLREGMQKKLKIAQPDFVYVTTGEGTEMHVHGFFRLPRACMDAELVNANKSVYDVLKYAGGLTDRQRNKIEYHKDRSLYNFAISNNQKPHGYMAEVGATLLEVREHKWQQYMTCDRNTPETLTISRPLNGIVKRLNNEMAQVVRELESEPWRWSNRGFLQVITDDWLEKLPAFRVY